MGRGHQSETPAAPDPPAEHGGEQIRLVVVTVNKIDVVFHNNVAQRVKDTEIEFAALFNLVKGQTAGARLAVIENSLSLTSRMYATTTST